MILYFKTFRHIRLIKSVRVENNYFVVAYQKLNIVKKRENNITVLQSQTLGLSHSKNPTRPTLHLGRIIQSSLSLSYLEALLISSPHDNNLSQQNRLNIEAAPCDFIIAFL